MRTGIGKLTLLSMQLLTVMMTLMLWTIPTTLHAQEEGDNISREIFIYSPNERAGLHAAYLDIEQRWIEIGQLCASDYGQWGAEKRMYSPCVLRASDGTWRAIWQVNDYSPCFAATYSKDLIVWRPQDYPRLSTKNCLKPIMFEGDDQTFDIFYISGNEKYSFLPVMLSLPMKEGNEYLYDVNVNSKFEKNPVDDTPVDLSVIKIWKNGSDSTNPSITVQLLRDYEVFDTVTLSKENSWKYTWNDLDSKYNWSVTEVKPNVDCIVDIGRDKNLFTITNTIIVPDASTVPETTNPEEQVTTSPSATTPSTIPNETIVKPTVPRTTVPKSGSTPSTKNSVSGGTIPQTGQLNWPVPVLIAVGIILIAIGIVLARKKTNE